MTIRAANVQDARAICGLVNYYAERGRMLHRSLESVYESLRDFLVASDGRRQVVGCVAVAVFWADLAEVKSLAVAPSMRGKGVGSALVRAAVRAARKIGIGKLFALTYETDFFARHGFETIPRDRLPEKVWRECIHCPKSEACDETAMMLDLGAERRTRRAMKPAAGKATRK